MTNPIAAQVAEKAAIGWDTWAAIASAILAAMSFILSLRSQKTAKEALELAKTQEERQSARLDVSLKEGVSWRPPVGGIRWILLHFLVVNPTDRDASIVAADLHVTYRSPFNVSVLMKIPHSSSGSRFPDDIEPLAIPAGLSTNGAVAGWLCFKIDHAVIRDGSIERLDAVIQDSRGPVVTVQTWTLREIENGQAS